MDQYIIYFIIVVAMVLVGGVIAAFLFPGRLSDRNKCIGCQYAEVCDKGDPNHICHLENK